MVKADSTHPSIPGRWFSRFLLPFRLKAGFEEYETGLGRRVPLISPKTRHLPCLGVEAPPTRFDRPLPCGTPSVIGISNRVGETTAGIDGV